MADGNKMRPDAPSACGGASDSLDAGFGKVKDFPGAGVRAFALDTVARQCRDAGLTCEFPAHSSAGRAWQNPWDVKINGATFAVKASTEHADGCFQFNHIRPYRSYEAVLCLGIASDAILFEAWSKADVVKEATGKAIAVDQISHSPTLRKHRAELRPIEEFERRIKPLTESLAIRRYRSAPETEPRKMDLLVHLGLHEIPDDGKSLRETMMEVSHNAKKRGLTREILQSILDEINSDASVRI